MGGDGGDLGQSSATAKVERLNAGEWRRRLGVAAVLDALGAEEGLTRHVGGAVRDDLLGLPVNDVDLATKLRPDDVIARLTNAKLKAVPTGIEHGTVTAVSNGQPFEVTSLRRDVSTDGRRAIIEYTDDWREDAARRDFTINALMADPNTGVAVYGPVTARRQGWMVFGGTSASSPIIASVYAMGSSVGHPSTQPYPATTTWAARAGLNDVTSGSNGKCAGTTRSWCTAVSGWDGPTGRGTPNGTTAF